MKVIPLRLPPGADLRRALDAWMAEQQEQAGCVISAVGSLSVAQLRFAGATEEMAIHGDLEILSLSGTLSPDGVHLHIAMSGHPGADAAGPVVAQQLHDRHRAGADAQTAQQEAPKLVQLLPVHCHRLGPAQRCFRLAEGGRWRQLSPPMLSTTNWRSCCSSVEVICDLVAAVIRVLATQVRFCGSR